MRTSWVAHVFRRNLLVPLCYLTRVGSPLLSRSQKPLDLLSLTPQTHANMSAGVPTNQNMPINVKILMLGLSSVGKSSLLLRFTDHQWLPEKAAVATVGVDTWVAMS